MTPEEFVQSLAALSFDNVFNPYRDTCPEHDKPNAPRLRQRNLLNYLLAAREFGVDTLWMGRDLGYRGGRRTGLPLTDEGHLMAFENRYPGSSPVQATKTGAVSERTAAEIWARIEQVNRPPLLWNVFPFHPHLDGYSMSNRRFNRQELKAVHHLNIALINMMGINQIVAIGRDAEAYASKLGVSVHPIRHPSYGGLHDFRRGICRLYPEAGKIKQRDFFELETVLTSFA